MYEYSFNISIDGLVKTTRIKANNITSARHKLIKALNKKYPTNKPLAEALGKNCQINFIKPIPP